MCLTARIGSIVLIVSCVQDSFYFLVNVTTVIMTKRVTIQKH